MTTLIFLLFASLFISQSSQESPELAEATELTKSVAKLFKEGKFDEALPPAKRALEIRERLLPRTDQRVAMSLGYLGDVYMARHDYDNARRTFERLLQMQEEQFGATDIKLAPTLDRLAVLYYEDGKADKAEEFYQRALNAREKAFGPEDVEVANSLYALGQLYRVRRQYDRALNSYKRSLLIYGHKGGVTTAEFQRASIGLSCIGYENGNIAAIHKELEQIQEQFAPGLPLKPPVNILNGYAVYLVKPEYPVAARARRLAGIVIVEVEIDEKGKVTTAKDICNGLPYLSESSVKAALKSRFAPTTLSGVPVKTKGVVQYRFLAPP